MRTAAAAETRRGHIISTRLRRRRRFAGKVSMSFISRDIWLRFEVNYADRPLPNIAHIHLVVIRVQVYMVHASVTAGDTLQVRSNCFCSGFEVLFSLINTTDFTIKTKCI